MHHPNVHWSTIYSSQDMEATQISIDRWVDKDVCVGGGGGVILHSHKKMKQ